MVFLLVVATLLAPILALVVAEHLRQRRRRKTNAAGAMKPGWVAETIKQHKEGRTHD